MNNSNISAISDQPYIVHGDTSRVFTEDHDKLTVFPSLMTVFSALMCSLELGCGFLLL